MRFLAGLLLHFLICAIGIEIAAFCFRYPITMPEVAGIWVFLMVLKFNFIQVGGDKPERKP